MAVVVAACLSGLGWGGTQSSALFWRSCFFLSRASVACEVVQQRQSGSLSRSPLTTSEQPTGLVFAATPTFFLDYGRRCRLELPSSLQHS